MKKNEYNVFKERTCIDLPPLGVSGLLGKGRGAISPSLYILQIRWWKYEEAIQSVFPEIQNPENRQFETKGQSAGVDARRNFDITFVTVIDRKVYWMKYSVGQLAEYLISPQYLIDLPIVNAEYERVSENREIQRLGIHT